jgi:EAL domain-containing protein (putative c-di-GMP-specific phosphodiesterase class I)
VPYQPLVDLRTRRITAVEALLRWHHPMRKRIAPLDFVPLAEETGHIVAIGGWVLETAVQQVLDWEADRPDDAPLSVSVNVSAAQLADPGAVDALADVIARTGIDPERLTLEVTESALTADLETTAFQMRRLAALGVRLSIDDFGAGYAGLGYLHDLPVDELKIDKSIVDGVGSTPLSASLVQTILTMSGQLGLHTVAGHRA